MKKGEGEARDPLSLWVFRFFGGSEQFSDCSLRNFRRTLRRLDSKRSVHDAACNAMQDAQYFRLILTQCHNLKVNPFRSNSRFEPVCGPSRPQKAWLNESMLRGGGLIGYCSTLHKLVSLASSSLCLW